ncbi:MAG: RNA polymerase sigma-70 factor [Niabella sp.]
MDKKRIERLIIDIAENDDQLLFKQLYRYFLPGLLSYANTLLRDKQLAEEAIEDVFVKVWSNRKALAAINNLSYYLYTATKHTALNYLQSKKKINFVDLQEADEFIHLQTPETDSIQKENIRQIEAAINELPAKSRLVFLLIKEQGLKYKEVSSLLSISPKTVEAHMTLAYSRVAECLEELLTEFGGTRKTARI